jgi:hypothetical protein
MLYVLPKVLLKIHHKPPYTNLLKKFTTLKALCDLLSDVILRRRESVI